MTDAADRIARALERIAIALERLAPVPAVNDESWWADTLPALSRMPSFTAASAIKRASSDPALALLLAEFGRPNGAMALGRRLAAAAEAGVVAHGMSIVRSGEDRKVAVYRVRTSRTSSPQAPIAKVRASS